MARVYPNGLADVNHFHAAGGLGYMIGELLDAGLLHPDTKTVAGDGLAATPKSRSSTGGAHWETARARRSTTRSCAPPPTRSSPPAG
jgi:phosphogluconate dehydratase